MPFAQDTSKTYKIMEKPSWDKEKKKANRDAKIWCAQLKVTDSKRFCSLNGCFRPHVKQHCLVIIFGGKGKKTKEVDKLLWDPNVHVYFQVITWADTKFCVAWAKKPLALIMKKTCPNDEPYLLFCDNLEGQLADDSTSSANLPGGKPWYGIPNTTDIWQLVEKGYASTLKAFVNQKRNFWLSFYNWLDDDDSLWSLVWSRQEMVFFIIKWCGNPYRHLNNAKYDSLQWRFFEKTSCMITTDSSNDTIKSIQKVF